MTEDIYDIVRELKKRIAEVERRPKPKPGDTFEAPTNLITTNQTDTTISLSWTAPATTLTISAYRIYRDGLIVGSSATTSYVDSSVSPGTQYTYRVTAISTSGLESALSEPLTTWTTGTPVDNQAPTTPTNLAGTPTATQVTLTWTASSDNIGVAGYTIYKNGVPIATTTLTSYLDTAVVPQTNYTYTVDAFDDAENHSGQSTAVFVTTPALPQGTDTWYVSPTGSATALGSFDDPFSLAHVLNGAAGGDIQAGHTVYLLDGTYQLTATQVVDGLTGTLANPINFYPYPGARPTLRNAWTTSFDTLEIQDVAYVNFYDIEFTMYQTTRNPEVPAGGGMAHVKENSANVQTNVKFYNCKFHDCYGMAIELASTSSGTTFEGCFFYYNGSSTDVDWTAWVVSANGNPKTIRNCVFLHNASDDIRVFSSDTTPVNDVLIDDNFIINSGSLYNDPARAIAVGGLTVTPDGIHVTGNAAYSRGTPDSNSRSLQLGNFGSTSAPTQVDELIASTADDGWWNSTPGFGTTSTIQIGVSGGPTYWNGFFRFQTVAIPQGATITGATLTLEFTNTEASLSWDVDVFANDVDNAVSPTDYTSAEALALTTAFYNWVISGGWTTGDKTSGSIAAVIQEVVSRAGWASGNDLMLVVKDSGSGADAWIRDRSGNAATAARLSVTYTTGTPDGGLTNSQAQDNLLVGQPVDIDGSGYSGLTVTDNEAIYDGAHIGSTETDFPSNTWTDTYPTTGVRVICKAYDWDTRMANILILNWAGAATVILTPALLPGLSLSAGQNYELRNAENYYSDRITGVFNGTSISVPMTGRSQAAPIGGLSRPTTLYPNVGLFQIVVSGEPGTGGDTTPPTVSQNLTGTLNAGDVDLEWDPSTDDSGVASYRVYRNGVLIDTVAHNPGTVSGGTNGDPQPQVGDYFVSTGGSSSNNGSEGSPWSISHFLSGASAAGPGDRVWIRGGTYTGSWTANLDGASGNRMQVLAYPGERPIFRAAAADGQCWTMTSNYVEFWNLEFTTVSYSRPNKTTNQPNGAAVQDTTGTAQTDVKWYGCFFKNILGQGYRCRDTSRTGFEFNACHFYYNGESRFDHGLYTWNDDESYKLIRNCLFHHNAGHDIHGYNSSTGYGERNYEVHNNIFWQTSGLYTVDGRSILIGSAVDDSTNNDVTGNHTFSKLGSTSSGNTGIRMGYGYGWTNCNILNNFFVGQGIDLDELPRTGSVVDGNTFYGCYAYGDSRSAFSSNTWASTPTSGSYVFIKAYEFNTQKGNLAVYNWSSASAVTVTHAQLVAGGINIASGDSYKLHNGENFFGDIIQGTYDGVSISIPMTGHTMETPIGIAASNSSFPQFGAFVIEVIKSGTPTPATQTYTDTTAAAGQSYSYQVAAVDSFGNVSALSTAAVVNT